MQPDWLDEARELQLVLLLLLNLMLLLMPIKAAVVQNANQGLVVVVASL